VSVSVIEKLEKSSESRRGYSRAYSSTSRAGENEVGEEESMRGSEKRGRRRKQNGKLTLEASTHPAVPPISR